MPRPSFTPTEEQRKLIKSMSAMALRQDQMCKILELRSPKTLRKHFRAELDHGLAAATLAVTRTAYEMATSGRYPQMSMFWDKCQRPAFEQDSEEQREQPKARTRARGSGLIFIDKHKDVSHAAKDVPHAA